MRKSFVFYRTFYNAFQHLPNDDRLEILMAVIAYALDDEEPKLNPHLSALFEVVRGNLDSARDKYERGKSGGRPTAGLLHSKPKSNQVISTENLNAFRLSPEKTNDNDNVNENENVNENANANANKNVNDNAHDTCINDEAFIELYAVQLQTTKEEILRMLNFFHNHCKLTDKPHESISEYKRHFNHWIRYQEVKPLPKKQPWEDPIAYENEVRRKMGKPPVQ
jgi:hypothetical protein